MFDKLGRAAADALLTWKDDLRVIRNRSRKSDFSDRILDKVGFVTAIIVSGVVSGHALMLTGSIPLFLTVIVGTQFLWSLLFSGVSGFIRGLSAACVMVR